MECLMKLNNMKNLYMFIRGLVLTIYLILYIFIIFFIAWITGRTNELKDL